MEWIDKSTSYMQLSKEEALRLNKSTCFFINRDYNI